MELSNKTTQHDIVERWREIIDFKFASLQTCFKIIAMIDIENV